MIATLLECWKICVKFNTFHVSHFDYVNFIFFENSIFIFI